MTVLKKIINFIKNILKKDSNIKMIDTPLNEIEDKKTSKFKDSIKVINLVKKKKKNKIDVLTCQGDGLGIHTKLNY